MKISRKHLLSLNEIYLSIDAVPVAFAVRFERLPNKEINFSKYLFAFKIEKIM